MATTGVVVVVEGGGEAEAVQAEGRGAARVGGGAPTVALGEEAGEAGGAEEGGQIAVGAGASTGGGEAGATWSSFF